ncbi:MAG: FemAB family XrtA/PEP-CTERM system-associated protein [candidate division WOR-3 bacterium]
MGVYIREIQAAETALWDAYVHAHPKATLYHLYGWRNVIKKTYGHNTYYLAAIQDVSSRSSAIQSPSQRDLHIPSTNIEHPASDVRIVGLLPLVHLKHFLFGNRLISMPFFDLGGILADNPETERALLQHAINLGRRLRASAIELRHAEPLSCLNSTISATRVNNVPVLTRSHKVRMLLDLPDSQEELMKLFKAKLRSQIRKPMKEGLKTRIGGDELLEDFYRVFSINMRDLGSPVHSKRLMRFVLEEFPGNARLAVVYGGSRPMAVSLVAQFGEIMENPWASSLRAYSHLSPNMLLYWSMLEYACKQGLSRFDFGRSSPGEGTYKFKEQWGARPNPLHWHHVSLLGPHVENGPNEKTRFEALIRWWRKLPVPMTRLIGPMIRKHIGL